MVTITSKAAQHLKNILNRHPEAIGLRFNIKASGCAQFRYVMDVAHKIEENEEQFEDQGIKVFVGKDSLDKIGNTQIDYKTAGLNSTIIFNNPLAANACGCGESFNLKNAVE